MTTPRDKDCDNCDWAKSRMYVLGKLENIERSLAEMTRGFAEFKSEMRVSLATRNGVKKEDVDNMIAAAVRRKRASDQLTKEDLVRVRDELHKSVEAHITAEPRTWEPWKYILLGAAIAIPNILIEVVKIIK